jgi:hypothetical protein
MNCHDARQHFSALIAGKVGLTEWAQVDAHVSECTECGALLEELYRLRPRRDAGQGRAPAGSGDTSLDRSPPDTLVLRPPRRRLRPVLRSLIVGTTVVILGVGTGLAVYIYRWSPERLITVLKTVPRAVLSDALSPAEPKGSQVASAPASSLSPGTTQSAPDAKPESPDRGNAAPSAASERVPARSIPSASEPERKELPPRKGAATASPERPKPASEPSSQAQAEISGSDVVVQLSVQDRGEAERDIRKLLARLGGTKLGRDRGTTLTVAIPRSSYSEFTRDLAQIGPSQMETTRRSLPDPVRVVVKLAK